MWRRTSSPTKGDHRARLAGRQPLDHHVREYVLLHLHGISRGLHHGRARVGLRPGRSVSRRLQSHRHIRHRAAHVGRRRRRPGARLDSHVHLHGRHSRAFGIGQGHAVRHRAPDEMVPGGACRLRHGHGHHPGRAHRRGRRRRDHPLGDRAAADDGGGLQQAARHRHHRVRRHARHPDPAGDHAGGDGRDAGDVGRQPVPGRDHAGLPAVRPLHPVHNRRRDLQAGHGPEAAARVRAADPSASSGARCGVGCSR